MTLLNIERAKYGVWYAKAYASYHAPIVKEKIADWAKSQLVTRSLASFMLVTAMLPMSVSTVEAPKASPETYKPHIVLNTTSADMFKENGKVIQIVPGESATEKIAREKAEADAANAAKLAAASRNTVSRGRRVYMDPSDFDGIYARTQAAYGVDARLLKAIHQVETGGAGSTNLTNRSGSGAQGPMQFLPSTWRRHGVDGNGDGYADINNVEDAIFTAAAYLKVCGYPDIRKALWGYNPSTAYYNKVMRLAGM